MKKWLLLSALVLFLSTNAMADVIMLHDGNIYLGKITSTDSSGIVIETFGQTLTISQSDILKSEKNFDSFKDVTTDITLKDGSIIKGKIQNYDEEIGIFVNIDFGTITLPVESIKEITNNILKIKNNGYNYLTGLTIGYYQPMGGTGKFSGSYLTTAFIEKNTSLVRGLYAGGDFSYIDMQHENSSLDYSMLMLEPYLSYNFFTFKNSSSFLHRLIPFVRIGGGLSYIMLKDNRPTAVTESSSELNPFISAGAGFDMEIIPSLLLRTSACWYIVPQSSETFQASAISIGAVYGF